MAPRSQAQDAARYRELLAQRQGADVAICVWDELAQAWVVPPINVIDQRVDAERGVLEPEGSEA